MKIVMLSVGIPSKIRMPGKRLQ